MPYYKIVHSVIKGLDTFKCLSNGTDRISDLSKELNLSKSTIHRLLKTLEMSKLVMQDPITHSFDERENGSASISFPIKNYICPVALSVLGPDKRFSLKVMMSVLEKIRESAARISQNLAETKQREESR